MLNSENIFFGQKHSLAKIWFLTRNVGEKIESTMLIKLQCTAFRDVYLVHTKWECTCSPVRMQKAKLKSFSISKSSIILYKNCFQTNKRTADEQWFGKNRTNKQKTKNDNRSITRTSKTYTHSFHSSSPFTGTHKANKLTCYDLLPTGWLEHCIGHGFESCWSHLNIRPQSTRIKIFPSTRRVFKSNLPHYTNPKCNRIHSSTQDSASKQR